MAEPYQTDAVLPRLLRGAKYRRTLFTVPVTGYTGKVFTIHVDNPDAGTRDLTISEAVGTGSDDYADDETNVTHWDDQQGVTWTISTTDSEALTDGVDYVLTVLLDSVEYGTFTLPVRTPPGGAV